MRARFLLGFLVAGLVVFTAVSHPDPSPATQPNLAQETHAGSRAAKQGKTLQISFGAVGSPRMEWEGEIVSDKGKAQLTGLNPNTKIRGKEWSLTSRRNQTGVLLAHIDAPDETIVKVKTNHGNFEFALSEIRFEATRAYLAGAVFIQQVPATQALTSSGADEDFPSCSPAPDGTIWCAYLAYEHGSPVVMEDVNQGKFDSLVTQGHGDQLRLMHFDGERWQEPIAATDSKLELWRPAVAVDGSGSVRVFWSQNTDGNWDLHTRRYDPGSARWDSIERITQEPGSDINVVATTSPSGRVWIAWQAWDAGRFVIRARKLGETGITIPDIGDRNAWNPAIGTDSKGTVYVAFDSYASGNYDVFVWVLESDGRVQHVRTIADSPRFEARPSLAVDAQDRVWVAFEDAGANWGKDFGTVWEGKRGVPFYLDRNILVRCLSGTELKQTLFNVESQPIVTVYPPSERQRLSFPRLSFDGDGRLWLLFREHALKNGGGEHWVSRASYFDRARWTTPMQIPHSDNLLDNRPALAQTKGGALLAIFSGDGRTRGTNTMLENNLYVAELEATEDARPPMLITPPAAVLTVETVHPNESEDIRRIRSYRARVDGRNYQLLRGEFHRHTEISSHRDQDGPMEEIWRYGLDVAQLDWIGPGDHDYGAGKEYPWWLTQKQIEIYHHPSTFVPAFTYERSMSYPSGHRNVMFDRRGIRALPRLGTHEQEDLLYGTPEAGAPDIKNLYAYLRFFDGICSSHTSATNMGTDWRDNDSKVEPVVEIYQGHRQNYEEPNAPKAAIDAKDSIGQYKPAGFVWNAFAKGYKLGFQVSSDHVSTHLSYAVVYAEERSRKGILEAFKKRHCYGANDNIILDVRSGSHMMGDEFTMARLPKLDITVEGTKPIAQIDIVRQLGQEMPQYVYTTKPQQQSVRMSWTDNAAQPGSQHMYYVRIMQTDGALAWASPMWVHYEP